MGCVTSPLPSIKGLFWVPTRWAPPPDILCLLLRLKYANPCGAASRLNPALRLQVNAVRNTSEVLILLFDVCVQLVIPEIKKLKLSLEAHYSAASLAANAKRDRKFSLYLIPDQNSTEDLHASDAKPDFVLL